MRFLYPVAVIASASAIHFAAWGATPPKQDKDVSMVDSRSPSKTGTKAVQNSFNIPGPFFFVDSSLTIGEASSVKLTLVRDYDTHNNLVTYYNLSYNYYNGAWTWGTPQYLYINFADEFGQILGPNVITSFPPYYDCVYAPGRTITQQGIIDFDFTLIRNMTVVPKTDTGPRVGHGGTDYKC